MAKPVWWLSVQAISRGEGRKVKLMKFGILADIHGHIENLRNAIKRLSREQVDQFVVLGDLIYDTGNAAETVTLLKDCGAIGVWGNHELGLCVDPDDDVRAMYAAPVLDYFSTLTAQLEFRDLLFSHTLPTEDARDPLSYYLGQSPLEEGALKENFDQFPHRVMMIGHFHRWLAATPAGPIAWSGCQSLELESQSRYLFIINAVMYDWAAVFDDRTNVLTPIHL